MIGYVLTVILLIAARAMPLGSSECFGIDARTTKHVPPSYLKGPSSRQKS